MANILVVEDEPAILAQMTVLLQRTKHTVLTASDGSEAIRLLGLAGGESTNPDIVILDIMMTSVNGYAVCKRMQDSPLAKSIPIILLSGYTDFEESFKKFPNIAAFIPKPIDPPRLLNTIADALAARRASQE